MSWADTTPAYVRLIGEISGLASDHSTQTRPCCCQIVFGTRQLFAQRADITAEAGVLVAQPIVHFGELIDAQRRNRCPLPLPPPAGYTVGPDGHLIPHHDTCAGMADLPGPIDDAAH